MYALSNAAPLSVLRVARFLSPPSLRLRLVSLSSGVTFSRVARSTACLLTPVWSATMSSANFLTSALAAFDDASLPASMSTWLAVTTMEAICASLGDCANAAVDRVSRAVANSERVVMHVGCTRMAGRSRRSAPGVGLHTGKRGQHGGDDTIAARAVEAEDAAARRVHVAIQRLAQQRTRAEEARTHRRLWDPERLGRLAGRHLLDFAHHEHRAERFGQLVDATFDHLAHLAAQGGIGRRLGQRIGDVEFARGS